MKIFEKLQLLKKNEVALYKEGVFWVAYEQDAYVLCGIKKLKPNKRFVKVVGREVVSVGFPSLSLKEVLSHFFIEEQNDTFIRIKCKTAIDYSGYEDWKSGIPVKVGKERTVELKGTNFSDMTVCSKVKSFKLYNATPMDCMRFVEELQGMLYGYL